MNTFNFCLSVLCVSSATSTYAATIQQNQNGVKFPMAYHQPTGKLAKAFIEGLENRPLFSYDKYSNLPAFDFSKLGLKNIGDSSSKATSSSNNNQPKQDLSNTYNTQYMGGITFGTQSTEFQV
eukprot:Pgem_evm1s5703